MFHQKSASAAPAPPVSQKTVLMDTTDDAIAPKSEQATPAAVSSSFSKPLVINEAATTIATKLADTQPRVDVPAKPPVALKTGLPLPIINHEKPQFAVKRR